MRPSWDEIPATGWDAFDREHADLTRALDALRSAAGGDDAGQARAAAEEVVRAFGEHFAHEERIMRETGYPRLAQHEEAHGLYLADAAGFARHAAEKGVTEEFRRWATIRVLEWYRFHVATNDAALGAFLGERQQARRGQGPRTPKPRGPG